ncbi:mitotic checkpoint serine/threonine-protein kinase BUB1 isoform X3 [Hevea brasiliensis]|uniref:mitotic checkpoint serine/threonine-protein kinase BUB1 isoform X3 n=1 Tax=Hevea brasiliensis TaxID=3981 RepID=UPI0025EE52FA|nr:mitotic checkpoint serine/threonine-protein kinase BUB1 isoform X3 [Hevea brasiliensis]
MTVMFTESENSSYAHDPLFPWLLSIKKALDNKAFGGDLNKLLLDCIRTFKHNAQYRNDPRFLKIWLLYLEGSDDSEIVFKEMEENKICSDHSLLYELYAGLLEAKENWQQAHMIYRTGILRKAKPLERLKGAHALFLDRMSHRVNGCSVQKIDGDESIGLVKNCVYPWSNSTMEELLKKINPKIIKYDGYHPFHKAYAGKVDLSSLGNASRNKIVKIGGKQYHIKGCAGQGGFAKVFKAFVNSNPDDIVALKMSCRYKSLLFLGNFTCIGNLISGSQPSKGQALVLLMEWMSIPTIAYLCATTYAMGHFMDDLTEDGFEDQTGSWADQGLCLVDWGKGIDLHLFPDDVEFEGDCRTSGFRCIEMQEKKPWRFQVDSYGLCGVVHLMLHNSYMEIEKKATSDGGYIYRPKKPFKRYWNVNLWEELFSQLLNNSHHNDKKLLQNLRERFQDYLCSNRQMLKKLKDLLAKQRLSLCSA